MQVVVIANTNETVLQSVYSMSEAVFRMVPKRFLKETLIAAQQQSSMHECVELISFANWQALCSLL